MAKKKITRKELLKGEDEFLTLSGRAANFVSTHMQQVKYLGIAVAVIAIAYLAGTTYLRYVNKKGQDAYNTAYSAARQSMKPGFKPDELKKSEELFNQVMDEYGLSKAARLSLPQVAYVKFLEKKYDEAIQLYRKFSEKISGDMEYESLTNLALAACYEAKGDHKTAMETLNTILGHPENPFKEPAMLSLARLYRLDNKDKKAREILKEFVEKYPTSPFLPMAKARL